MGKVIMRIIALSDIHYRSGRAERLEALAQLSKEKQPDVLVLAGDLAASSLADVGRVLQAFSRVAPIRIFVAGNHDIWSPEGRGTLHKYEKALPVLCRRCGFHMLDQEPVEVEGVGFVGCIGWYDYSCRQLEEPMPGVRVSPARPSRRSSFSHLQVLAGREEIAWRDLVPADYRGKALLWREDGRLRSVLWNDAIFVNWGIPDEQVVDRQVRHLRESVEQVSRAEVIVAVTHVVPFREAFTEPYRRVDWAFCRAYLGCAALGESIAEDSRVKLWITGHVHYQTTVNCRGIPVVNVAAAEEQRQQGPTVIELSGEGVEVARIALPRRRLGAGRKAGAGEG